MKTVPCSTLEPPHLPPLPPKGVRGALIHICYPRPKGAGGIDSGLLPSPPLGESDRWTPMGSIGPQKSGRVVRKGRTG
jgi:hypothetical protein